MSNTHTPATTDRDTARLPLWARQRITKLESDVDYWKEKASAGPENSNTFVDNHSAQKFLGWNPRIKFVLTRGTVEVRVCEDHVEVRADVSSTRQRLAVMPRSSNVFDVDLV